MRQISFAPARARPAWRPFPLFAAAIPSFGRFIARNVDDDMQCNIFSALLHKIVTTTGRRNAAKAPAKSAVSFSGNQVAKTVETTLLRQARHTEYFPQMILAADGPIRRRIANLSLPLLAQRSASLVECFALLSLSKHKHASSNTRSHTTCTSCCRFSMPTTLKSAPHY